MSQTLKQIWDISRVKLSPDTAVGVTEIEYYQDNSKLYNAIFYKLRHAQKNFFQITENERINAALSLHSVGMQSNTPLYEAYSLDSTPFIIYKLGQFYIQPTIDFQGDDLFRISPYESQLVEWAKEWRDSPLNHPNPIKREMIQGIINRIRSRDK